MGKIDSQIVMSKKRKISETFDQNEPEPKHLFEKCDKKYQNQISPHLRLKWIQTISSLNSNDAIHIRPMMEELERIVFLAYKDNKYEYTSKIQQLLYNFQLNFEFLSQFVSSFPHLFLIVNDDFMCKGTKLEQERIQEQENIKENQKLLKKTDIFGPSQSSVYCMKCVSKGIKSEVYTFKMQTRGCDEPMTCFCMCTSCGKRWKN